MEPHTVVLNIGPLDSIGLICNSEKTPNQSSPGTSEASMKDVWLQVSGVGRLVGRSRAGQLLPQTRNKPTLKPRFPFIGLPGVDLALA